ncbi:MlaD family protein [Frateuria aurantia]
METRAHHVLIGLFTVLSVAAALVFALWLGRAGGNDPQVVYRIIFNESVSGLSQGAAVQYNGISVGEIRKLQLDPADPRRVIATIRVSASTPVKRDTHAKLMLTSVTGGAVIMLSGGTPASPPLQSNGDVPPTIIADASPLSRLLNNGEDMMTSINEIVSRVNQMVSPDNIRHINQTLEHVDEITTAVASERQDLHALVSQMTQLAGQTQQLIQQSQGLVAHTDALMQHQGRQILDNSQQTLDNLQHITQRLDQLLSRNQGALDRSLQGAGELGPAIHQLQRSLIDLRQFTSQLKANPSSLLRGEDQSKEFVP